ncbi:serine hydrolase domain-containing protein [Halioglobus maricola]|nr:serine hydrolase domain-containing protein [Halioglobus maricola]
MLWPLYGFMSHQKGWPHLPIGWMSFTADAPQQQVLGNPDYAKAGDLALAALVRHRKLINAPAITAAVAIDGEHVWAGAAGWADLQSRQPATVDTQFRIGSTSKALTGTALGRMMQADLIDLDQPLNSVLQPTPNPQWGQITPRQLASHMAGLPHYRDTKDIAGLYHFMSLQKHYDDVEDAVSLFDDTPLLSVPGESFSYSSLGTVLLSAFMQRASKVEYQQWVEHQVLGPLQMHATTMNGDGKQLATPYWRDEALEPGKLREWRKVDLSHRLAGGGFISTSSDLVRLGSGYFNPNYLRSDIVSQIWQPQRLTNGEINEQKYALGWRRGSYDIGGETTSTYHHGGVSRGGQSWLIVIPEFKAVIAVNANINTEEFWDFAKVYRQIASEFLANRKDLY